MRLLEGEGGSVLVGIDVGGTGTRVVAMTHERRVVARATVGTPRSFAGSSAADFLAGRVEAVAGRFPVDAIGIGASGPIEPDGTIRNPDTLPAFTGEPIAARLMERYSLPIVIDNDAVCAAIAEHAVGAGAGADSLLHVTLGTGIGTAFLIDGVQIRSGDGRQQEAGHISVPGAWPCYCGRRSCWEQAASRLALQRTASRFLGLSVSDQTALPELARRANAGEPDPIAIFSDYGCRVADGLGTLLAVYRPGRVVLGGSAAEFLPFYRDSLDQALQGLGDWISRPTIVKTQLDDYGGAIGAALLAQRAIGGTRGVID